MVTEYAEHKKGQIMSLERDYMVVKHNKIIQKSRHNLSVQEQKIILYLISKIKPEDTEFDLYEFKISEFCKICGIEYNGKNYNDLKESILNLSNKGFWAFIDNNTETIMRWVEKAYITKGKGTISIRLDNDLRPYLLQIKAHFTQFSMYNTLAMKNKYTIRFYELLKSYQNLSHWEFDYEELSILLSAEKYTRFSDFRRRVLKPSIDEINRYSDIYVTYEVVKMGVKNYKIAFLIKLKDMDEKIKAYANVEKKLDPRQMYGQMSLFMPKIQEET